MGKGKDLEEHLVIGDSVHLFVMGFAYGQVRIGVNAPKEIGIDREELRKRKIRSKRIKPVRVQSRKERQKTQSTMVESIFLLNLE